MHIYIYARISRALRARSILSESWNFSKSSVGPNFSVPKARLPLRAATARAKLFREVERMCCEGGDLSGKTL